MAYTGFTLTTAGVSSLAARFGNAMVTEQTNLLAPYVAQKLRRKFKRGAIGIVNIKAGGLGSTGWLADGGALPAVRNKQPKQGTYLPKALLSRLGLPRLSVHTVTSVDDGVDLVIENLESMAEDIARLRGRSFIKTFLGNPAATVSGAMTSFTVNDPSGFRVGMAVAVYTSGDVEKSSTETTPIIVTGVDLPANPTDAATINCDSITITGDLLTTDKLYILGSQPNGPVSLADVNADASLYGQSQNENDWKANLDSNSRPLELDKMRDLLVRTRRRRGLKPDCVLVNSRREQTYSNFMIFNRRFMPGQKMDAVGGQNVDFEGIEVFVDENVPDSSVYFTQSKDMMLHEFVKLRVEGEGPKDVGFNGLAGALIDRTDFVYEWQVWEACNLRCTRRDGNAHISAITG